MPMKIITAGPDAGWCRCEFCGCLLLPDIGRYSRHISECEKNPERVTLDQPLTKQISWYKCRFCKESFLFNDELYEMHTSVCVTKKVRLIHPYNTGGLVNPFNTFSLIEQPYYKALAERSLAEQKMVRVHIWGLTSSGKNKLKVGSFGHSAFQAGDQYLSKYPKRPKTPFDKASFISFNDEATKPDKTITLPNLDIDLGEKAIAEIKSKATDYNFFLDNCARAVCEALLKTYELQFRRDPILMSRRYLRVSNIFRVIKNWESLINMLRLSIVATPRGVEKFAETVRRFTERTFIEELLG